jgi:hypothetical protein
MRWTSLPVVATAILLLSSPANAYPILVGVVANDTGGIIPWSPEAHRLRHAIASAYCARYFKYARITSVRAQYGDYIGFACHWRIPGAAVASRTRRAVIISK